MVFAPIFVAIGVALLVRAAPVGGCVVGYVLGALFIVLGVARFTLERRRGAERHASLWPRARPRSAVALRRRVRGDLVVAPHRARHRCGRRARADAARLLVTGCVFVLVSLSYAEGTAAIPETGGAATSCVRAFNDLAGFTKGWVLFLDFLIVMALSALFAPHYLAAPQWAGGRSASRRGAPSSAAPSSWRSRAR